MPFAGYPDHAACVLDQTGKVDDPDAYCAELERRASSMSLVSHVAVIFPSTLEADDGRPAIPMEKLTWRDDIEMMFRDETGQGHDGARFVGNVLNLRREMVDGEPWIVGDIRYAVDSQNPEIAERARMAQQMADEDRINGLSADITVKITEMDEDGFPIDFEATLVGVTQAPMQAFDGARVYTAAQWAQVFPAAAVVASAATREVFFVPEPDDDDPRYVAQPHGEIAIPLTIEGRVVYGHAGVWGQCHTGFLNKCVSPPESQTDYALFHTGVTVTADGQEIPTSPVFWRGDHAPVDRRITAEGARNFYAHHAYAWADVRATNGKHGVWISGVLRDDVTDDEIETLRKSTWSGDWRRGELVALLTVNNSAYPVARGLVASALIGDDEVLALVASGQVQRDEDEEPVGEEPPDLAALGQLLGEVNAKLDRLLPQEEPEPEAEVVEIVSGRIARVLGS